MNPIPAGERIDLMGYLAVLRRKAWLIAAFGLVAFGLSIGIAITQKRKWVSVSRLLPSESKSETSGLAGLAALAGINMPQQTSFETFYNDIIMSHGFLDTIIQMKWKTSKGMEQSLAEAYQIKVDTTLPGAGGIFLQRMHDFIRKKKIIVFEREPTGLMTLTCTTLDPQLSYELNAFLLARLDEFNRVKKKSRASEKKVIVEERLKEVEQGLRESEERLQHFREKNISVSTPSLILEQQRLIREVEVNGALYQELRKQFEISKIEIVDNTQFLNVLENPIVPTLPAQSTRRKLVLISTLFGLFLGVAVALGLDKLRGPKPKVQT
jgi:uncharacterized protein involved in exopolysaccharide biosynthesis